MTRKTALKKAIALLSAEESNTEICEKLTELCAELPLIHWNEQNIRDRVEQFIEEEKRFPTVSDFRKASMPPHPIFRQKFGITLGQWLHENYPQNKPTPEERQKLYSEEFKREYRRIKPRNQDQFNRLRSPGAKSWQTVAKHCGVTTWSRLLRELKLTGYSEQSRERKKRELQVRFFHDLEQSSSSSLL